ncbi:hypothetical protein BJ508DRAFT_310082 [Ascobolus immersus RN42]|uniref:Uncharacterized protein n=1 Tax=Ascobolus immersus RN42 TaxID=1160509 RepID=A0A3N4HWL5_ASCIM|nr:hypothetical protein BJ508DRAFT_310082 [Ascobolus immersus RN42]
MVLLGTSRLSILLDGRTESLLDPSTRARRVWDLPWPVPYELIKLETFRVGDLQEWGLDRTMDKSRPKQFAGYDPVVVTNRRQVLFLAEILTICSAEKEQERDDENVRRPTHRCTALSRSNPIHRAARYNYRIAGDDIKMEGSHIIQRHLFSGNYRKLYDLKTYSYCHIIPYLAKNESFLSLFESSPDRLPAMLANYYITQELNLLEDSMIINDPVTKENVHTQFHRHVNPQYSTFPNMHLAVLKLHLCGSEDWDVESDIGKGVECKTGICAQSKEPHIVELRCKISMLFEAVNRRTAREQDDLKMERERRRKATEKRLKMRMCYLARTLSLYQPFLEHLKAPCIAEDEIQVTGLGSDDSDPICTVEETNAEVLTTTQDDQASDSSSSLHLFSEDEDSVYETWSEDEPESVQEEQNWVDIAGRIVRTAQLEYSKASRRDAFSGCRQSRRLAVGEIETDATDFDGEERPGKTFGDLLHHLLGRSGRAYPVVDATEPCKGCSTTPSVKPMLNLIMLRFQNGFLYSDEHFQRPLDAREERETRAARWEGYEALLTQLAGGPEDRYPNNASNYRHLIDDFFCDPDLGLDSLAEVRAWTESAGACLAGCLHDISEQLGAFYESGS